MSGRQKLRDPLNTCHSVAICDCLGRKNVRIYKYPTLYFTLLYFMYELNYVVL